MSSLDLFSKSVRVWNCPRCGRDTTSPHDEGYGQEYCPEEDCGAELGRSTSRDARWVTVAVYEVSLAYGGPEEGGWWYHAGSLIPGTQRSFLVEDAPQAAVYQSAMLHRYREDETWMRHQDFRTQVHVFCDENAPAGFPRVRPRYC